MCGIVAASSATNIVPILIEGLKKLECRGYDSAGIAIVGQERIDRIRSVGRVAELEAASGNTTASTGIAHTRWANQGAPAERNAHPHVSGSIAVVLNDQLLDKLKSNLKEVQAGGMELYGFANRLSEVPESEGVDILHLRENYGELPPVLHVVPLQLLSYHAALVKGTHVDKPENLANSAPVEQGLVFRVLMNHLAGLQSVA
jgi:glucosamine 6-phosphate synthetase-like amidotransferase/phosphosugar isomerase protein